MLLNNFSGGLSTRLDPSLIAINEAIVHNNIDPIFNSLKSAKDITDTGNSIGSNFYKFRNSFISSNVERDYVEYQDSVYFTEKNARAQKYKNGEQHNLGIVAPVDQGAYESDGVTPILDTNNVQKVGLVFSQSNVVEADFYGSEVTEVGTGTLAAATYEYRIGIQLFDEQILYFDKTVVVASNNSSVNFFLKTNNYAKLYKKSGGTYYLLKTGIGKLADNGETLDTSGGNAHSTTISTLVKTIQYCYTYYNSIDGTESAPNPISAEQSWAITKKITISNFTPIVDSQVDRIRLYRIGGNITSFTLVTELVVGTTSYVDFKPDTELTTVLESQSYQTLPVGAMGLVQAYGLFFAFLNDKLYYSIIGKPNYWPAVNFIDFDRDITGLIVIPQGLLVFTQTKTYLLVGTDETSFAKVTVNEEHGSLVHKSGKLVKQTPIWQSYDGFCLFSGGVVQVISKDKLGKLSLSIVMTAVYDEQYLALLSDGSIFIVDFRFGMTFRKYTPSLPLTSIYVYDNTLYGCTNGKLVTLFTGSELSLSYTSPEFSEGQLSTLKTYNDMYFAYNGVFNVQVLIDGSVVTSHDLNGNKVSDFRVPADLQEGYKMQFVITGVGVLKEIEYKVVGRQNGR